MDFQYLGLIFANLLTDLVSKVEVVSILVKNCGRPIIRVGPNNARTSSALRAHPVLRVTLIGGEAYAVDLAGFRFGWHELVMRWKHYAQHRVYLAFPAKPLGNIRSLKMSPDSPGFAIAMFHRSILRFAANRIREKYCSDDSPVDLSAFLGTRDQARWTSEALSLVSAVKEECKRRAAPPSGGSDRGWLYLTENGEVRISFTRLDYHILCPV